ncbi:uncharacterized protein LOC123534477 [Mercenaria mercenaria]|uniref:uncharacterized protein LOC123534477 n=1 Tax=Mercenaria mercenaria TaxID=6596 RepID=UPI001E1D47AC|nr:uncharacterized protein LOC123534477 [Mercenaria mercenaria]
MRISVAIFVLAVVALASAKPTLKRNRVSGKGLSAFLSKNNINRLRNADKPSQLTASLRSLMKSSKLSQFRRTEGESEYSCPENLDVPCLDITDDKEFFECASEHAEGIEGDFIGFFEEQTGVELLRDRDWEFLEKIFESELLAEPIKYDLEDLLIHALENFFEVGIDWEDVSEDAINTLIANECIYGRLEEEAYARLGEEKK